MAKNIPYCTLFKYEPLKAYRLNIYQYFSLYANYNKEEMNQI